MVYRTVLTLCTSGDRDYELNTVGERGEPFSYKVPETLKMPANISVALASQCED